MLLMLGGPTYTFLEPQLPDNLIEGLAELYSRLVDLGVEYQNGRVYLADAEEATGDPRNSWRLRTLL